MNPEIDILLSTFNGSKYLQQLLESINLQSFPGWRLLVRDDGSTDATPRLLAAFQEANPGRCSIIADGDGNLGAIRSFEKLMHESTAPYVMFCDQDDVWFANKLESLLNRIQSAEAESPGESHLAYSDLRVTDENLKEKSPSFFRMLDVDPGRFGNPYYFFYKNPSPGAAMILNRKAVQACLPIGRHAVMHDWWCMIACSLTGKVSCLNQPTMYYRLHGGNHIGLEEVRRYPLGEYLMVRLSSPGRFFRILRLHSRLIRQAKETSRTYRFRFSLWRYFREILKFKFGARHIPGAMIET